MKIEELNHELGFCEDSRVHIRFYLYMYKERIKVLRELFWRKEITLADIKDPALRLSVILLEVLDRYDEYIAKGLYHSEVIDTFKAVKEKAMIHKEKEGYIGIYLEDLPYLRHILDGTIFRFGPLEYTLTKMVFLDKRIMDKCFITFDHTIFPTLKNNTPIVLLRVRDYRLLERKRVEDSLHKARYFFRGLQISGLSFMVLYSWTLFEPLVDRLPLDHELRSFQKHFTLIGSCADDTKTKFDLSRDTSIIKDIYLSDNKVSGVACGVIRF